jgi:hypothetical protein
MSIPQFSAPNLDGYTTPFDEQPVAPANTSSVPAPAPADFHLYPPARIHNMSPSGSFTHPDCSLSQAGSSDKECIPEEDVHMHICQDLATGKSLGPRDTESNLTYEIIEYQNKMTATSILGELLGQKKVPRLVKIVISGPGSSGSENSPLQRFQSVRELELLGLDKADQDFLLAKGAFDLPPRDVWYADPSVPSFGLFSS